MTVFYGVRHAHADWSPDEQRPLSERGRRDAMRVAEVLSQFPIAKLYTSPFLRACQTIAPLATDTAGRLSGAIVILPDLRERKLSHKPVADFERAVATTWRDFTFAYPGGESNAQAQRRVVALVQELHRRYQEEHLVLSTHGNLLALLLQHFDPAIDFEFWASLTMPDIYTLSIGATGDVEIRRLWA
jgi:2,3-bisphosphoglycerate-dependent phosphoglycerate mutase